MMYYVILSVLFLSAIYNSYKLDKNKTCENGEQNLDIRKKSIYWVIAFFLIYISAFRGGIGTDWRNYKLMFDSCHKYSYNEISYEIGYYFLECFIYLFTDNFWIFQLIISCFSGVIIFKNFQDKSKFPIVVLFIYYCQQYFGLHFETMRQTLAMAIVILGGKYIEKKKFISWIILVLLAMQFHVSAIVALPLYFTTQKQISAKTAIILWGMSIILTFVGDPILRLCLEYISNLDFLPARITRLANTYPKNEKFGTFGGYGLGGGLGNVVMFIIELGIMLFCYSNKGNKSSEIFLLNFLSASLISGIGRNMNIISRLSLYYLVCGNGLMVYTIFCGYSSILKKVDRFRIVLLILLFSFMSLSFYSSFNKLRPSGKSNAQYYIPYKTFLYQE